MCEKIGPIIISFIVDNTKGKINKAFFSIFLSYSK